LVTPYSWKSSMCSRTKGGNEVTKTFRNVEKMEES
jgi:hypothetical protein